MIQVPEKTTTTEARILDTAEVVFARRGLAGTRVREIAAAAAVNGATLYNYYPSKDALYEAVLERGIRPLSAMLAELATEPHPADAAHRIVRSVMQHLAERPHLSRLIYLEAISEGDYLPKLARKWFRPVLAQIVAALKAGPTPAHLDEALFPHLAALFVQLSFGHFALAPLLAGAMGEQPLSPEGIARQTRLIETVIEQLFPRLVESAAQPTPTQPARG
ncbi:MAG: TetR/AcrR family transcriptional regulator [Candidatus Binatia bacterium]